jgi:CRP-like cAMP-binding protein
MASDVDVSGKLSFLNLGELLQLLGSSCASGTLRIFSSKPEPGVIMIDNGNPINAANGALSGLDALFPLFGWTEGRFEFTRETPACERTIKKGRMEVILDGLRLLDEGRIEKIGPAVPPRESADGSAPPEPPHRSDLPPLIKGPLVDYSYVIDEEGFYDGDEIVREGSHGNWIWVILEGAAEIAKSTPSGPLKLLRVGDGGFLGSLASLLTGTNVRSSTVTASGNVQLGMLDSQLLTSELANLSADFKTLIRSLDKRLRCVTTIAAQADAGDRSFMDSIAGMKIAIKEGQTEDRLFRIREGQVAVARQTPGGHIPLVCLEKGDFFGHIPFLTIGHEPYEATVFSSPDLKLAAVDSKAIEAEHRRLSTTLRNIIGHLGACISATTLVTITRVAKSGLL